MKIAPIVLAAALAAAALGGEAEYDRAVRRASHPAATPWAHGALPGWGTSASGPLRAFPEGFRPVEYVESTGSQYVDTGFVCTPESRLEADFEFTQVSTKQQRVFEQYASAGSLFFALYINGNGNIGWAWANEPAKWNSVAIAISARRRIYILDGPGLRFSVGATSRSLPDVEISEPGTATARLGAPGVKQPYGKWYSATIHHAGVLVRDFRPAVDADGVACLLDLVEGKPYYSATETPLVAGPPVRPAAPPSLAAARRNWYASALLATNGPLPVVSGELAVFDTLILPEGLYATRRNADEIIVADPDIISAVVARYRARLAPTNIPVWVEHDRRRPAGRVTGLWRVVGEGLWARVEASAAIVCGGDGRWHASAEMRVLRATAADDWGPWAEFVFPWAITGLALTMDPALETPAISDAMIDAPISPYPGIVPEGNP